MTKPSDRQPDERFADWVDERMTGRERDRFEGEMRVNKELRQQAEAYRRAVEQIRGALQAPMPKLDIADEVLQRVQHPVAAPMFAPRKLRTLRRGPLLASGLAAAALLITAVLIQSLPTKVEPTAKTTADARGLVDQSAQDLPEAMGRKLDSGAAKDGEQEKAREELQKFSERTANDDFLGKPQTTGDPRTGDPKPGEAAAKAPAADRLEPGAKQEQAPEVRSGLKQPPAEGDRVALGGKDVGGKEGKETDKGAGGEAKLDRGDAGRLQAAPAPLQQLAVVPTVQAWVLTRHMATVDGAEKSTDADKSKAAAGRVAPVAAQTENWRDRAQAAGTSFLSFLSAVPGPAGGAAASVTQLHYDFSDTELAAADSDEAAKNARRTTFYRGIEALGLANKDAANLDNSSVRLQDSIAAGADGTTALFLVEGTQAQVGEVLRVVSGWALRAAAEKRLDEVPAAAVDSLSELNERRKNAPAAGNQVAGGGGAGTGGKKAEEKKDDGKKDLQTFGGPATKSRGGAPKPPAAPPVDHVRVLIVLRDEVPPAGYKKK